MEALITNDLHLGVRRNAGTTLQTQASLRQYLLAGWIRLIMLEENLSRNLIINGDAFDAGYVDTGTMLAFYSACVKWLAATVHTSKARVPSAMAKLIVSDGNHDLNKDSAQLCSLHFVMQILKQQFPERVVHVTEPTEVMPRVMIVPHVQNQDKFDLILADLAKLDNFIILLHANYDNNFAVQSDHSLNVSAEQAKAITDKECHNVLIFGHEHQRKTARHILITGNQFPSSVADCLGNDDKVACILRDGENFGKVDLVKTWEAKGSFIDIDWMQLDTANLDGCQFIRVSGEASKELANDVISAIARLRKTHDAYVITNAVKIEGVADMGDIQVSLEDARKFDLMGWLMEQLTPAQQTKIKELQAHREAQHVNE